MDYGHKLQFGTFLTPVNRPPQAAVELAVASEKLGFDLVTFQDHPYQPSFLDTWTLMTWTAARTEKIHISANVLNIAMRPAAVTARAAASVDLLSGGRFDLALGAGGFWDAMEAMGVRRLTPGQAVDALSEAIDVIRGIWAVGDRTPLRIDGEHYRLHGAKRGPAPAHEMPIWLGGLKPRMLRLIGRKGDGWLPSLAYLQPGDLSAGQAAIDEAARRAGRDPREIRRLLNISGSFDASRRGFLQGPSQQWVDELLPLILQDGVSAFILASDDPGTMERFAGEVAPPLREALDRERGSAGTVTSSIRSTAVRARRREDIAYDDIPPSLVQRTVEPGDFGYSRVRSTYLRAGSPGLVIQATTEAEVVDALAFARSQDVPLAVRSGGHGVSGRSTNDGGIVIDLSKMNRIDILDETTRRVRIQPGARWSDVAASLSSHGWALSSGDYGGVGVGGLATAGGIGWLVREHGLTIDHLRAVDVVLADGSVVRADSYQNADVFWAVRGAGANIGIVTSFEFEVDEVSDVGFAQLVFDASDTAQFLREWGAYVETAPRDLTSFLIMGRPRRGEPVVAQVVTLIDADDPQTVIDRLQPIADLAPLLGQSVHIMPYDAVMDVPEVDHDGRGEPNARSGLIEHITGEFAAAATELIASGATYFFQIRSVGGAVADVPEDATAYAHRSANFSVTALGGNNDALNAYWDRLQHHFTGLYLSFETDQRPDRINDAFPAATLRRLRAIKSRVDPDNVFHDNFGVALPVPARQLMIAQAQAGS